MKKTTTEDFVRRSREVHGVKYDYSKSKVISGKKKVIVICPEHGDFIQRASAHMDGQGCMECRLTNRRNTLEDFLSRSEGVHGKKFDYSLIKKIENSRLHVNVICKKHGIFKITPDHHINRKQGCPKCKSLNLDGFIKKANLVHNFLFDYSEAKYINNKAPIEIICKIHGVFIQRVSDHINGKHGCPECTFDTLRLSTDEFIKKSNEKHNNEYIYIKENINFKQNKEKVPIICQTHGVFKQRVNAHLNGAGCPICRESSGEKKVRHCLIEKGLKFDTEHTFLNCKNIRSLFFDFYLSDFNICIEFNGLQHYQPVDIFGGDKAFKSQQKKDKIKVEYCKNNNIPLLIIKYDEDINFALNKLFDNIPIIA